MYNGLKTIYYYHKVRSDVCIKNKKLIKIYCPEYNFWNVLQMLHFVKPILYILKIEKNTIFPKKKNISTHQLAYIGVTVLYFI